MKQAFSRKNLWAATPQGVKNTLGRALSLVPPALLLGGKFRKALSFAREAEWWPAERSRQYQLEQLRKICLLAYERTEYYRGTFDAAGFDPRGMGALEDIRALPTINKHTVVENLERMCAVSPDSPGVDYGTTGGTSGMPLRFYMPANRSFTEYAYLVAGWERAGYRLDVPLAVLRGKMVQADRKGFRHEYDPLLRHHFYSNFHTSDDDLRRYVEHIASLGPCFLHVYPSSVACLARFLRQSNTPAPSNVLGVLAGSENVEPSDRDLVEQVVGWRYFSWYGHSEKLVLAAECEHSSDYHVWPTYGFFELLDEQGNPVTTPGQRGEIVGTGFINTVVPFIRYRTGDYAVFAGHRCASCGREHTILRNIEGRWPQGDLIAADGSAISMTTLNVHDDTFDNVRDYQFRQSTPGQAVLCVLPARPLSGQEQQRLLESVTARLQGQVKLELNICAELQKTERGKQPRIISSMHLPAGAASRRE